MESPCWYDYNRFVGGWEHEDQKGKNHNGKMKEKNQQEKSYEYGCNIGYVKGYVSGYEDEYGYKNGKGECDDLLENCNGYERDHEHSSDNEYDYNVDGCLYDFESDDGYSEDGCEYDLCGWDGNHDD